MNDIKMLYEELRKSPMFFTLLIIATILWGLLLYLKLATEINGIGIEIGAALAQ